MTDLLAFINAASTSSRTAEEVEAEFGKLPRGRLPAGIVKVGDVYKIGDPFAKVAKKKATKRPKRLEGFKARKRKLREIAHKLREPAVSIKSIALDNLIAQADALGAVVVSQVDDIDDCPPLKIAIDNLQRAKALYAAA